MIMAVKRVLDTGQYQGLSSDEKPGATNGSVFHIIDTGEQYIMHDDMWEPDRRLIYAVQQAGL